MRMWRQSFSGTAPNAIGRRNRPHAVPTYAEVAPYGEFIEYVTSMDTCPLDADPEYSHFVGEKVLTPKNTTLSDWVAAGKPEGDPADNPGIHDFPSGSQIGEPDHVLTMSEPYVHGGDMTDEYQVFVLPAEFGEDASIRALEVMPGNHTIAHHAILGLDDSGQAAALDAADPELGYEGFGGFGFAALSSFFGAWVPGALPVDYPPGIGRSIPAGADLLVQMHYGPSAISESDQTEVNVFLTNEPIEQEVITAIMGPQHLDTPFILPPNKVSSFHGTFPVSADVSLINIAPHCHLIGSSWLVYATSPNNQDTIPLISIPDWDFNWQGFFTFPTSRRFRRVAPFMPRRPTTTASNRSTRTTRRWVGFGEGTEDEMFFVFLDFVLYENGDESISLGPDAPCRVT